MRIGLIGAGMIGGTIARLAVDHGHDVVVSNSRGPDTLAELVATLGPHASAADPGVAAAEGDLVVVTIPLKHYRAVPVDELVGKTVIDTNNYYPERDGHISELDAASTTSSELLAAHLPGAHVVKAFNTIYFEHLATQGLARGAPDRRALPIASTRSAPRSRRPEGRGQAAASPVSDRPSCSAMVSRSKKHRSSTSRSSSKPK